MTLMETTTTRMPIARSLWHEKVTGTMRFVMHLGWDILTHHDHLDIHWLDTVHQHSAFLNRLSLARHRPVRKTAYLGRDESIRSRVHVQPRFKNHSPSSPHKGMSGISPILYFIIIVILRPSHCSTHMNTRTQRRTSNSLADACPNVDILACHVIEVSVTIRPGFMS
jgi:hypothetical protein